MRERFDVSCAALLLTVAFWGFAQAAQATPGQPVHVQQVLIRFKGSIRAPASLTRTKDDARRRAMEVIAKATSGARFADLVKEYSEEPGAAEREGDMGDVMPGVLLPEIDQAARKLSIGEVSPAPVQSTFGFHVLRRLATTPPVVVRHVLVTYAGAARAKAGVTRTKDEAKQRAVELAARAQAGDDFARIAQENSDDATTAAAGGLMGTVRRGLTVPAFEAAVFSLKVGETSEVIETPFGFQIVQRIR